MGEGLTLLLGITLDEEGEELNLLSRCQPVPLTDRGRGVPLAVPLHPLVPDKTISF